MEKTLSANPIKNGQKEKARENAIWYWSGPWSTVWMINGLAVVCTRTPHTSRTCRNLFDEDKGRRPIDIPTGRVGPKPGKVWKDILDGYSGACQLPLEEWHSGPGDWKKKNAD